MASSNKDKGTPEERELLDIVTDMMMEDSSKDEIINSLIETGLKEEEAKDVYKKAKEEYEEKIGSKLNQKVDERFEERKEAMMDRMDAKIQGLKDDLETKRDLNKSEQKEYTDNKVNGVKGKVEDLEDQLFSLRSEEQSHYKELSKKIQGMGPSSKYRKILAYTLILTGVLVIIYAALNFTAIPTLLEEKISKAILGVALEAALILTGIITIKFGKDVYLESSGTESRGELQSWVTE